MTLSTERPRRAVREGSAGTIEVRCPNCRCLAFTYEPPVERPVSVLTRCRRCGAMYGGELRSDVPRLSILPR